MVLALDRRFAGQDADMRQGYFLDNARKRPYQESAFGNNKRLRLSIKWPSHVANCVELCVAFYISFAAFTIVSVHMLWGSHLSRAWVLALRLSLL